MRHVHLIVISTLVCAATVFTLFHMLDRPMTLSKYILSLAWAPLAAGQKVDLGWYAPKQTWINDLSQVINGTGTHGFIFNSSVLPRETPYGTYNWCNMPHVRASEYPKADKQYKLEYVEVVGHCFLSIAMPRSR